MTIREVLLVWKGWVLSVFLATTKPSLLSVHILKYFLRSLTFFSFLWGVFPLSRREAALLKSRLDLWMSFHMGMDTEGMGGSVAGMVTFPKNVMSGVSESLQIVQPGVEHSMGFLDAKSTRRRIGEESLADMWRTLILSADKLARRSWRRLLVENCPFSIFCTACTVALESTRVVVGASTKRKKGFIFLMPCVILNALNSHGAHPLMLPLILKP